MAETAIVSASQCCVPGQFLMRKALIFFVIAVTFSVLGQTLLFSQDSSGIVVFGEAGFPAADSSAPSPQQLAAMLPRAQAVGTDQLGGALAEARLLVLPYGSAFPEEAWPAIKQFLDRGGNLLVLGGMPFTRAAYRDHGEWHLREYSVRFIRPLMIDQYQETSGSEGMQFQANPELTLQLRSFAWKRAFSPVIRLSAVDLYHRGGAAGSIDAHLDSLAWGVKNGRKMSAPVIEVDHYRNGFDGGRWILVNAELPADVLNDSGLIQSLAERALHGAEEFTVRPVLPLYLPGEPVQLQVLWHAADAPKAALSVSISPADVSSDSDSPAKPLPITQPLIYPSPKEKGLHTITARLMVDGQVRTI